MQKVTIVGLGYVGFPLLCAVAQTQQYYTCGYDISKEIIEKIRKGVVPVNDPMLDRLDLKSLKMSVSFDSFILENSDIMVICVPTPVYDDFTPNLDILKKAVADVTPYLKKGALVILESTVNPGVSDEVMIPLLEDSGLKAGVDFHVAFCPERINPGDFKWNVGNIPRNIGGKTQECASKARDFYQTFIKAQLNIVSSLKVSEASKIVENTFRDINIAFVNELAKSFDMMDIDITEVIKAASNKPFSFLPHYPSCGVGGHCIPVDPYYMIHKAAKKGFNHKFLKIAREVNNSMPEFTVDWLIKNLNKLNKSVRGTSIGLLGLSFKKNIGDLRESPALKIKKLIENLEGNLFTYDPYFPELSSAKSLASLLAQSEAVVIATDHDEFTRTPVQVYAQSGVKLIIDGKNCLDKKQVEQSGMLYKGIGR